MIDFGFLLTNLTYTTDPWDNIDNDDDPPFKVRCSGTKISPRIVITAGHCIYDDGKWTDGSKLRLYPGADGLDAYINRGDPSPNGWKGVYNDDGGLYVHPDWKDYGHEHDDMGWVVLKDNNSSCDLPWFGVKSLNGIDGDIINIYGYPDEEAQCTASWASSGECYASLYGNSGNCTWDGTSTMHYTIDTQPGQSGSGIYEYYGSGIERYVVGVHRGPLNTVNKGVKVNNGKADMINWMIDHSPSSYCD